VAGWGVWGVLKGAYKATDIQIYKAKNAWLAERYNEVSAEVFYRDVFPVEFIETKNGAECYANPIITYTCHSDDGRRFCRNEIVFRDTFTEAIEKTQGNSFALCSMCSYSGRTKTAANAFKLHGFCIDLDGVQVKQLENLARKQLMQQNKQKKNLLKNLLLHQKKLLMNLTMLKLLLRIKKLQLTTNYSMNKVYYRNLL
jgi:hypothetical protein